MKKLITILVLSSAMLSACEGDPEIVPRTPTEAKIRELMIGYDGKVDMNAFVTDAQRGVWVVDACDMTYTDGKVSDGSGYDGGTLINHMMLLPTGICRTFFTLMHIPGPTVYSEGDQWSVSGEIHWPFIIPGSKRVRRPPTMISMLPGRRSNCSITRTVYS